MFPDVAHWILLVVCLQSAQRISVAADNGPAIAEQAPATTTDNAPTTVDRTAVLHELGLTPADYAGQPVIIVLHRGIACVRCVSTLSLIGRRAADFRGLGIKIIAVSPALPQADSLPQLQRDLGIAFPLLADPERALFRRFRCVDAQSEILHGVFLIDADGQVAWRQISEHAESDIDKILRHCRELVVQQKG